MIAFQMDVLISNGGNDTATSFFYAKSATNTFLALMTRRTLERPAGLISRTKRQLGGASLDDSEPEIWVLDKSHKLNKYHIIHISVTITPMIKQIAINAVVGTMIKADVLGALFLKCVIEM